MTFARAGLVATALAVSTWAVPLAAEAGSPALDQSISGSKRVRVTLASGSFELLRPSVEDDGLHFQKVMGYPPSRARRLEAKRPPPPEPPTSPVSWEAIERVEKPVRGGPKAAYGITGLLTGAVFGLFLGAGVAYATNSAEAGAATWAAAGVGGLVLGAMKAGEEWRQVYPETSPSTVPEVRRR